MIIPIRKRLIALSILSLLVPLMLFSLLFYILGSNILLNDFKETTLDKMYLVDQALTLYIEKIKHTVNTIANNPILTKISTEELTSYRENNSWTPMKPFMNSKAEKEIYEYLKLINLNNPDLGAVYIGTESGRFVMYPPSHRRPFYDPSERPWFREAKEMEGMIKITSPFHSSDNNYYIFAIAKYIHFPVNRDSGVVSVNIDLMSLTNIIEHLTFGTKNSFVILAKSDNTIIANIKDPTTNFKKMDSAALPAYYNELCNIGNLWAEIVIENKTFLAKRVYSIGTDWQLYTLTDKNEIIIPFKTIFYIMIALSLVFIIILSPVVIKISIDSLSPLKQLSEHLKKISAGSADLQKKIPVYANDEVGNTIDNFNIFSDTLNSLLSTLQNTAHTLSSNNSSFSSQMLIASADISKSISSIENAEKEIVQTETCLANSANAIDQIEKILDKAVLKPDSDKGSTKDSGKDMKIKLKNLEKPASVLKAESEQMHNYLTSLHKSFSEIKETVIDINGCVEKTTDFCRNNKKALTGINKILGVYNTKSPEDNSKSQPPS